MALGRQNGESITGSVAEVISMSAGGSAIVNSGYCELSLGVQERGRCRGK